MESCDPPPFGQRILILVPHPDDEIVACGAALRRAQAQGATLFALYLTHGCPSPENLWPWERSRHRRRIETRRAEALKVAALLNLQVAGYSDRPARGLWPRLSEALHDVRETIQTHAIDQIWVPAYEGGHPDHDGLNALAFCLKEEVDVLEFAEYNFAGGKPHSHVFPQMNGEEITLTLTPEEQQLKRESLKLYASEQKNLGYVQTEKEVFRPLATYDYSLPAHGGKVWYNRFDWVPFAHPRIDRTRPEDVCRAIEAFFAEASALPESARQ